MTSASLAASGIGSLPLQPPERGVSRAAADLAQRISSLAVSLREPLSLGGDYRAALAALKDAAAEAAAGDWDGYGAAAVSPGAVRNAEILLAALPTRIPAPEVSIDPDGEVALEWHRAPDWVLSLSIGPRGSVAYAARFGRSRVRGLEEGADGIPADVLAHLHRLFTGVSR